MSSMIQQEQRRRKQKRHSSMQTTGQDYSTSSSHDVVVMAVASPTTDMYCEETDSICLSLASTHASASNNKNNTQRRCGGRRVSTSFPLLLIAGIGASVCAAFLAVGIQSAYRDQQLTFEKQAGEIVASVASRWNDYHLGGLWIQEACRSTRSTSAHPTIPIGNSSATSTTINKDAGIRMCSREDFRGLYEYMITGGLIFQAIAYVPNVTHAYRAALEQEASLYYTDHEEYNYTGFFGFTKDQPDNPRNMGYSPERPFYFPQHLVEPLQGNQRYVDFDVWSSPFSFLVDEALEAWTPVVTAPIPVPGPMPGRNQVMLMHPGAKLLSSRPQDTTTARSTGLSAITIPFHGLMQGAIQQLLFPEPLSVYIYDTTERNTQKNIFFGGVDITATPKGEENETTTHTHNRTHKHNHELVYASDLRLEELRQQSQHQSKRKGAAAAPYLYEQQIAIEQQTWTVVVVAQEGTFQPHFTFVILGGCFLLSACICLAVWLYSAMKRDAQMTELKHTAESEKAALRIDMARRAVQAQRQIAESERRLNEYLAHEVRNPLTSAMSACSFLATADSSHQEDIHVIRSSLAFINDLLRSMLDMHKVQSQQLELEVSHTDVLKDILEPVRTILHQRDNTYQIDVVCPHNLVVLADRMRVKQIILNLAGNSRKFVQQGFIRLRAELVYDDTNKNNEGWLQFSVEDSGPGIPVAKQQQLFSRFQSSLDSLNQGTGMGLCLCKSLVDLMKGSIELDQSFDSGVPDCPGTRFVISLPECHPVNLDTIDLEDCASQTNHRYDGFRDSDSSRRSANTNINNRRRNMSRANSFDTMGTVESGGEVVVELMNDIETGGAGAPLLSLDELPETLSVLVVDDDLVLRKLLRRSLVRVAPNWTIQEASNGETSLVLTDTNNFDLIFMDQYMASVDKQLLGTETVYALRAKGFANLICGLSANDMAEAFVKSGADAFLQKPFSCDQEGLREDLLSVLNSRCVLDS